VNEIQQAVSAIRAGEPVIIPTDTVYGLVCTPYYEVPMRRLAPLKGRSPDQPIALLAASVDWLLECVPELRGRVGVIARALLPGPYTLVVPNPACRYPWLTGRRPDAIGVRVPEVEGPAREFLAEVAVVAATSANRHGGTDPRRLADVPPEILDAVAATIDGGELPGTPSTVLDLTAPKPRVLREGAASSEEAIRRVREAD